MSLTHLPQRMGSPFRHSHLSVTYSWAFPHSGSPVGHVLVGDKWAWKTWGVLSRLCILGCALCDLHYRFSTSEYTRISCNIPKFVGNLEFKNLLSSVLILKHQLFLKLLKYPFSIHEGVYASRNMLVSWLRVKRLSLCPFLPAFSSSLQWSLRGSPAVDHGSMAIVQRLMGRCPVVDLRLIGRLEDLAA